MAVRLPGPSLRFFQLEKEDVGIHGNRATTPTTAGPRWLFDLRDRTGNLSKGESAVFKIAPTIRQVPGSDEWMRGLWCVQLDIRKLG
jgi:hypothetical protein